MPSLHAPTPRRWLRHAVFALLYMALGALLGIALEHLYPSPQNMLSTRQALVIEGPPDDAQTYRLPPGTVLYFDRAFPEGHVRYRAYFNYRGVPEHDPVPLESKHQGSLIAPTWLYAPEDAPL
ncbi:hypothetical protein J4P02_12400 [Pseudomonas sp. NFXW11]|uniref:hypothetical protein n=1 Tax=Pseudomonas sp. NFXW11 TaxID=2819531 RepID=UPI003CF20D2A